MAPDDPGTSAPSGDAAMTVTAARRVPPGREQEFEAWAAQALHAASGYPGFLGGGVLRPPGPGQEWHVVYRFADRASLGAWERSERRAALLRRVDTITGSARFERVSGLETWFSLPGRTAPAPPRWKMAVVTFAAIYPLALLINALLVPPTADWPLLLRPVVFSGVLVPLMTWVVMPRLTRLLEPFLYPRRRTTLAD